MAEIALAVVAKLAEYLVHPLVCQGQYLFCASNITKTLETEKQKLASTQDEVQKRVRVALNKTEQTDDVVDKWLGEVNSHMDEVQKLERKMKESNSCFQGRCPTWRRYRLCRQMTKMIEATKNLNQRSEFNPFSILAPLPEIEYFSSGNFLYFQSTKLASDQLLAALQDNGVHMIGLYGMGGSGKTTLVTEVGNNAKKLNLFDRVIITTVSQTPNIRKIQGEIADDLRLRLHEESDAGRAKCLSMRLGRGERILLILDDVWEKINLKDVGIPFQDNHVGCKVVLTTRLLPICNLMDCERKISLHLLSEEESWTLFQKHARNVDESLANVAQGIVSECKGLPIAIQAVGASLRGKSIEEWKEALQRLRDSKPIDVESGVRDAFSCLQLSYDYLRRKEAKSLFLMCSMYPEDANISVEDLFRITIGLGMCEELGSSLEDARNKVSACINHLIDSCLLMRSEKKKDHLRMHDTIRDVALWISSQQNRTIVVNLEKDMKATGVGSIKDCYAFTSWYSQIPQQLDAPKLEILLLTNIGEHELSEANFRGMGALKVMQIDSKFYKPAVVKSLLPHTMNLLPNLRTLRLQHCQLGDDLSWVLCLKRLEVLDLRGSSFNRLPQGLEELSKLKMLDLSRIKEQSFKIIERCVQLQELYASRIQLSRTTLNLEQGFSNDASFPRLKRFDVEIGKFDPKYYESVYSRDFRCNSLSLRGVKISTLSPFIKYLLQQAETVSLYEFSSGCKNIILDFVQVLGGMNELTSLCLHSCSDLECLADATPQYIDLFFPKLIKLTLDDLANLKEIWRGPPLVCFFEKLQELYINDCPLLTSLLPKSVVRASLLLQKLIIVNCSELLNIIEEDGDGSNNEIISASNNAYLLFSKLKSLTIKNCDKLQYVFSNSCAQGLEQLEEVHIYRASRLKYALGHHEDVQQEVHIKLPILRSLELWGLKNLLSIFPTNFHSSCPCLRKLHWVECPKFNASCVNIINGSNTNKGGNNLYNRASASLLFPNLENLQINNSSVEDILFAFEREDLTERNSHNQLIPPLNTMELKNLLELKFVWHGTMGTLSLQNLRKFEVSGCNNLRTIFSPVILKSLPLLEYLIISDCNELEEIMSGTEVEEQHQGPPNAQSPKICFPNLQSLTVERCNKLKCMFSSVAIDLNNLSENILPNLRWLTLEEVPSLKDFCQGLPLSNECLPQLLGSKLTGLMLGSLSEVWLIWRAPSHILNLVHLQDLILSGCNELEYIFGEGFHGSTLPKLEYLQVEHCNKLKSLLSASSVTLLFPHLDKIWISECEELEELFRHISEADSSHSVKEIVLPNLIYIKLKELPSLVDICKGFKLPATNLSVINMSKCPKFSSIMGATGSMWIGLKEDAEIDANNNDNHLLHQLPYFYPESLDLMELEFQELGELRSLVCKAFTSFQNMSFYYLQNLTVKGCGKVKCIFSMSVLGSLPRLGFLSIKECEEVEEIIKESEEVPNSHFPILNKIIVKRCHKLKYLVRTALVGMLLPQLEWIKVSEAAQMEELFSTSDQGIANMQQIELPNLNTLKLSKLPALTHFCKGLNNLNAPYLHEQQIKECPNFVSSLVEGTSTETTE